LATVQRLPTQNTPPSRRPPPRPRPVGADARRRGGGRPRPRRRRPRAARAPPPPPPVSPAAARHHARRAAGSAPPAPRSPLRRCRPWAGPPPGAAASAAAAPGSADRVHGVGRVRGGRRGSHPPTHASSTLGVPPSLGQRWTRGRRHGLWGARRARSGVVRRVLGGAQDGEWVRLPRGASRSGHQASALRRRRAGHRYDGGAYFEMGAHRCRRACQDRAGAWYRLCWLGGGWRRGPAVAGRGDWRRRKPWSVARLRL